jgi:hypothetical protein
MISRTYDIMGLWYHIQYQIITYRISSSSSSSYMISLISRTCDIMEQWYQSTYNICVISAISSMISYMISRCLYPPLKTCLVERCRSRALQVQVHDVQNQQRWSSTFLDEARLGVRRIRVQTGDVKCVPVSHRPWTSGPPPSSPSLPRRPTESAPVDAPALQHRVVLLEVEHAACKTSQLSWAFWLDLEWHYNIDNIWNPSVHAQFVLQLIVSEDVKQRAQMQLFATFVYQGIRRTVAGLDAHGSGAL